MRRLLLLAPLLLAAVLFPSYGQQTPRAIMEDYEARIRTNFPEYIYDYSCEVYSKMELDVENVDVGRLPGFLREQLGFIVEYSDTSSLTGRQYVPALFSESLLERRHTACPYRDEEDVKANRISGINPENNLLSQFTGSMQLEVSFHEPYINVFGASFPSPAGSHGTEYYVYQFIDSLEIDGRETYLLHYRPKVMTSLPVFEGSIQIDASSCALKYVNARMVRGCNVNWIRDMMFESSYRLLPEGIWFRDVDKAYVSLSPDQWNLSDMAGIVGRRELYWGEPSTGGQGRLKGTVMVDSGATGYDEQWWSGHRHIPLTSDEEEVFGMVSRLQEKELYKKTYGSVYSSFSGYASIGKISIGPMIQVLSFNDLEGWRPRIGFQSNKYLSTRNRFGGFMAYGFKDRQIKGGVSYEHIFRRDRTRKLSFDASYDVVQLGVGSSITYGNILSSIWHSSHKIAPESRISARYDHEFSPGFNAEAGFMMKRIYASEFVPMYVPGGDSLASVAADEIHLGLRFSKEETVNRGYFDKKYLYTGHPVLTVDLTGAIPGLRTGDYGYFKPELGLDWKIYMPPLGVADLHLKAGAIFGQVPWQFLYLYKGNPTIITDEESFSCMDYFEFSADSWASLMLYHDFRGAILGFVPGVNKLGLRETFLFRMALGSLRDCNDGTPDAAHAPVLFPEGMQTIGHVPYMEIGAGITNIFRVARVDFIWRLTHRERELPDGSRVKAGRLFTVNVGLDLKF